MIFPRGPGLRGIFNFGPSIAYLVSHNLWRSFSSIPFQASASLYQLIFFNSSLMHKRNSFTFSFFAIFVLFVVQQSCVSHDFPQFTCPDEPVTYSGHVSLIVSTKCAIEDCHNGDNGADKNWTNFSLFQGKSETVKIYVVNHIMPPSESRQGPLTQDEINKIACWVDQGAQNN